MISTQLSTFGDPSALRSVATPDASRPAASGSASNAAALDSYMQGQLNPLASKNIKACLPNGLAVPFPHNTFSLGS